MKVALVTGSRKELSREEKRLINDRLVQYELCIVGDARGVDMHASKHFQPRFFYKFWAEWERYGNSAGPRRNGLMADFALTLHKHGYEVHCEAFPRKDSRGTKNCIGAFVRRFTPLGLIPERLHVTRLDSD